MTARPGARRLGIFPRVPVSPAGRLAPQATAVAARGPSSKEFLSFESIGACFQRAGPAITLQIDTSRTAAPPRRVSRARARPRAATTPNHGDIDEFPQVSLCGRRPAVRGRRDQLHGPRRARHRRAAGGQVAGPLALAARHRVQRVLRRLLDLLLPRRLSVGQVGHAARVHLGDGRLVAVLRADGGRHRLRLAAGLPRAVRHRRRADELEHQSHHLELVPAPRGGHHDRLHLLGADARQRDRRAGDRAGRAGLRLAHLLRGDRRARAGVDRLLALAGDREAGRQPARGRRGAAPDRGQSRQRRGAQCRAGRHHAGQLPAPAQHARARRRAVRGQLHAVRVHLLAAELPDPPSGTWTSSR